MGGSKKSHIFLVSTDQTPHTRLCMRVTMCKMSDGEPYQAPGMETCHIVIQDMY